MSQFVIIKDLISNLRKEEIRSLRRFLQLFEEGSETSQLKGMAFLELLLSTRNYPEEKICKKLYGDDSPATMKSFNKMLLRFKDKVYESLTLDINLFRKDRHDDLSMAISEVRKLLLQVNVLEEKAPVQEVLKLYDRIRQVARKYELYDELLQAMSGKISFMGRLTGQRHPGEHATELLFYDRCRHSLLKAREVYHRLVQLAPDRDASAAIPAYEQALEEMEHEYRYTKSAAIGHILYELTAYYQQALKNYDAAEKASQRVISIVSENPSVYRNERMTKAFLDLANIELRRFKFRHVESAVLRAQVYSKGYALLAAEALEISFLSCFYRGDYEKAEQLLTGGHEKIRDYSLIWSEKLSFFLAALKTVLGKTHEALLLLQQTGNLEKELVSWNSGIRLMIILNLIEAEKLDAAESQIENYRKYLERASKNTVVSDRDLLIAKILGKLANESFDFHHVLKKEKSNFSLLESNIPQYVWQPKSPEIIMFHSWIQAKASGKKYASQAEEWFDRFRKVPVGLTLFD